MALVLLAAGASSRMGARDKLLEIIETETLLRRQARAALTAGLGPVAVTLPPDRPLRAAALAGLAVMPLPVPEAATGMSASLRAAADWAQGHALMVIPADMPDLTSEDFRSLANAFDGETPLRACTADGMPGHPVLFPAYLLPLFGALCGDDGARTILRDHPPRLHPLPGQNALTDLDTPQDWDAWRTGRLSAGPSDA